MITAHADTVGSLLRPAELLQAQRRLAAGEIDYRVFKQIEDHAVDQAIALQEQAGLEIVTDGEMRRQSFQSQMTAAVAGFGEFTLDAFLWGDWHDSIGVHRKPRPQKLGVTGKLVRKRYLSVDEFLYLKQKTTRIPKVTLPSPGLWVNFWSREYSSSSYPTLDTFLADVVAILRAEVEELVRLGATYIQIDAPHYGLMLDSRTLGFYEEQGWSLEKWVTQGVDLDNAVIRGFPSVTFALHL
jgi:5-methyltetrahydropteroyltriglutamate--homocysteine methyltransferase